MRIALAMLLAAVVAAGWHWGTFAVGGSDSYCYIHQAQGWAAGRLQPVEPLALEAPWPDAPLTFAPAGHVPSPTVRGAAVPICPAGLSIAMAPFQYMGAAFRWPDMIFLVVPLFGALLIGSVYVLGSRFSPRVGLASALLATCSPAFLFQLMQPMSDVPAAALWMLAAACATGSSRRSLRSPLLAGLATSAAILVRPNLLPLGMTLGMFFLLESDSRRRSAASQTSGGASNASLTPPDAPGVSPTRQELRRASLTRAAVFAMASAPGCLAVGLIQQIFYGSPLRSGYGSLDAIFGVANIAPNATRYFTWMWQTHTPIWILALAAPFLLRGSLSWLLLALAAVNVACYLPYTVFNDWWYLRFMLPGIAMLLVLTVAVVDAIVRRVARHEAAPYTVALLALTLSFVFIRDARARSVFDLQRLESRYLRAGAYVAGHLPPNALVITSWESGSVRYYSNRTTLVWDALDPVWLDRSIAYSRSRGLEPYLLFERWEEPIFRQRFAGSDVAKLDWPAAAEIAGQVRIYRPDDRDRYLRGDSAPTEYAR